MEENQYKIRWEETIWCHCMKCGHKWHEDIALQGELNVMEHRVCPSCGSGTYSKKSIDENKKVW